MGFLTVEFMAVLESLGSLEFVESMEPLELMESMEFLGFMGRMEVNMCSYQAIFEVVKIRIKCKINVVKKSLFNST